MEIDSAQGSIDERCFYDGEYVPALIRQDLEKVLAYIEDIKQSILGFEALEHHNTCKES